MNPIVLIGIVVTLVTGIPVLLQLRKNHPRGLIILFFAVRFVGQKVNAAVALPGGYIVATSGIQTRSQPHASSVARSPASSRG